MIKKTDKELAIELVNNKTFNTDDKQKQEYLESIPKMTPENLKKFISILKKQNKSVKAIEKLSETIKTVS